MKNIVFIASLFLLLGACEVIDEVVAKDVNGSAIDGFTQATFIRESGSSDDTIMLNKSGAWSGNTGGSGKALWEAHRDPPYSGTSINRVQAKYQKDATIFWLYLDTTKKRIYRFDTDPTSTPDIAKAVGTYGSK